MVSPVRYWPRDQFFSHKTYCNATVNIAMHHHGFVITQLLFAAHEPGRFRQIPEPDRGLPLKARARRRNADRRSSGLLNVVRRLGIQAIL
jgi:hypothetical protein